MSQDPIERIIDELSSFLTSSLISLGIDKYPVDKEDLLQEIRIRIWKAYKNYNSEIQYLNAYIKKIVYSVFINEVNKLKKEAKILETERSRYLADNCKINEDYNESQALKECLIKALAGLKAEHREVIKLRLEGISIGDIANMKKWSYRKTCNILYRGIKVLKKRLREEGYSYED